MTIDELEANILGVAENDSAAIAKLLEGLAQQKALEAAENSALAEGLPVILEDPDAAAANPQLRDLALHAARLGVDVMAVRDTIAASVRKEHGDYPDPAGLIKASAVLDSKIDIRVVRQRLEIIKIFREDSIVWHNSFGLGTVTEIDGFSDLVSVKFQTRQTFSMAQSLATLFVAKPASKVAELSGRIGSWKPEVEAKELDEQIGASFLPRIGKVGPVTASLIVPRLMAKRDYDEWRNAKLATASKAVAPKAERTWDNARSLEELIIGLDGVDSIEPDEEKQAHILTLFNFAARKPMNKQFFATAMGRLWLATGGADWQKEMIGALPQDSIAWSSHEEVIDVIKKLSAKEVVGWLNAVFQARGREWFDVVIILLPARLLSGVEGILKAYDGDLQDMQRLAIDSIRRGTANADIVVWLWKQKAHRETAFSNPIAIFRVLNKPAKGDYIKARRDLLKLVVDDQSFQKRLMRDGDEAGISALVKTTKNTQVLNKGEQQSLLVKICRIYPEAREIVEERRKIVARRPMDKKSSFASIQQRQAELKDIVEKRIPANIRQISLARSYGDLRENAEFKAAKEEQRLLRSRQEELERGLKTVQGTDFSEVIPGDIVIPGASITIKLEGKDVTYHIVGLWDSDPKRHLISFDTPLGKAMMGKKIGDDVVMPTGATATVKGIAKLTEEITASLRLAEA
ncbi:MAG TPA: hypothetical protein DCR55_12415 [Lentisphaeria bacterium]|nr:hypothetical protein [Lentisphaeria bacterium]